MYRGRATARKLGPCGTCSVQIRYFPSIEQIAVMDDKFVGFKVRRRCVACVVWQRCWAHDCTFLWVTADVRRQQHDSRARNQHAVWCNTGRSVPGGLQKRRNSGSGPLRIVLVRVMPVMERWRVVHALK